MINARPFAVAALLFAGLVLSSVPASAQKPVIHGQNYTRVQ